MASQECAGAGAGRGREKAAAAANGSPEWPGPANPSAAGGPGRPGREGPERIAVGDGWGRGTDCGPRWHLRPSVSAGEPRPAGGRGSAHGFLVSFKSSSTGPISGMQPPTSGSPGARSAPPPPVGGHSPGPQGASCFWAGCPLRAQMVWEQPPSSSSVPAWCAAPGCRRRGKECAGGAASRAWDPGAHRRDGNSGVEWGISG